MNGSSTSTVPHSIHPPHPLLRISAHIWHGPFEKRRYGDRYARLLALNAQVGGAASPQPVWDSHGPGKAPAFAAELGRAIQTHHSQKYAGEAGVRSFWSLHKVRCEGERGGGGVRFFGSLHRFRGCTLIDK